MMNDNISSVSSRRPSISKIHAFMGGTPGIVGPLVETTD